VTGIPAARGNDGTIAGVVLAAGLGRRFGGGKLAAPLDGQPLVGHVLDLATAAMHDGALESVLVVGGGGPRAGSDAATVAVLAASHGFTIVENDDPEAGLGRSVRLALAALQSTPADAALMLLGDQPRVRLDVIRALADRWRPRRRAIVMPRYGSGPGNPVLLDRSVWPFAGDLTGDVGMIAVARLRPELVTYVDVDVDGANPDVDTPDELAAVSGDRARNAGRIPPPP
jgi:CTP:molybdopterin cytidylyltransferase MocA